MSLSAVGSYSDGEGSRRETVAVVDAFDGDGTREPAGESLD